MKSVFGGLGRVRVFVSATLIATAGVVAMPAVAHADTLVGCDTPGLVAAINAANTAGSGTLDLTAGCTYKLTSADPSTYGLPVISGNVTIHGDGATIERVATAPQFGLIYVTGTLAIDHLTLTGGSDVNGGGIFNVGGTLVLTSSTVSGNTASAGGGGIYNHETTATVTNTTVSGNTAREGGGIFNDGGGTATVTDSTISANTAFGGGGVFANGGSVRMTDSTVSGNTAASVGGAIFSQNAATLTIADSTVSDNAAPNGGGGGIDNTATLTVASTIVSGNSGGNCDGFSPLTSGGYNLDSDGTCGLTTATDQNNVDPLLGPLQENGGPTETMVPGSTSPVVDAIPKGTNGCGTTVKTDQRGVLRPQSAGCDIGAYETGDVAMQTLAAKPKSVLSGANVTYTAAVVNAGAVDATGVTVSDTLPAGLSFTSVTTSQGSCAFVSPTLTCTLGQVPAAATAKVKITVKVTAAPSTTVTDQTTASATTGDTIPGNDTKTAKVTVT